MRVMRRWLAIGEIRATAKSALGLGGGATEWWKPRASALRLSLSFLSQQRQPSASRNVRKASAQQSRHSAANRVRLHHQAQAICSDVERTTVREHSKPEEYRAYAPLPSSVVPTGLRVGSWFQRHERLAQLLGVIAVALGLTYLVWRVTATREGADPVFFWVLLAAEVMGFAAFVIMVIEAWHLASTPRLPPRRSTVDIVIATYDEDIDVVEPTIAGAVQIRGETVIHLCDDGRRPEMKALAERYGVRYVTRADNAHAKAGNINAVLPSLTGELLLILDADHVASPDILEALSGYFDDAQIALVQSAHSFRNHNSVMHVETGRHEQSLFFDVLLPGRNRLASVFWCGSAALIRTSALRDVGGIATQTSTEDFETSLLLQAAGYRLVYHNEHLVQGLAPDTLRAYAVQRARWAEGTLSAFHWRLRLPFDRALSAGQRTSYFGTLLYYLTPLQRLVYFVVLISVGWWGVIPVAVDGLAPVALWSVWMLVSMLAVTALHRGASSVGDGMRYQQLSFEAHLRATPRLFLNRAMRFAVTPKNEVDRGGWVAVASLRLPLLMAGVLAATLLARALDGLSLSQTGMALLAPLPAGALFVICVFAMIEITMSVRLARRAFRRQQLRRLWRFPVSLSAQLAGETVACVDLHQRGAAIVVPVGVVELATSLPLSIAVSRVAGGSGVAHGTFTITSRQFVGRSGVMQRVGGSIEWSDETSRALVIEHCYITEPFRARQRAWVRSAPRVAVSLPAWLDGSDSTCVDVSLGGAAFVTTDSRLRLDATVPLELRAADGESVTGMVRVKSIVALETGGYRVGGSVTWNEMSWLAHYGAFVLAPRQSRRVHGVSERAAA